MTQTKIISLSGDCTVSHINHSCRTLVDAFESDGSIVLDLSQVEATDVTLIQLIVSASKTAAFQKRAFSLQSLPDHLRNEMCLAGIEFKSEAGQIVI